jgi:hypothetical protein
MAQLNQEGHFTAFDTVRDIIIGKCDELIFPFVSPLA